VSLSEPGAPANGIYTTHDSGKSRVISTVSRVPTQEGDRFDSHCLLNAEAQMAFSAICRKVGHLLDLPSASCDALV
jgi:hypothetical protein